MRATFRPPALSPAEMVLLSISRTSRPRLRLVRTRGLLHLALMYLRMRMGFLSPGLIFERNIFSSKVDLFKGFNLE